MKLFLCSDATSIISYLSKILSIFVYYERIHNNHACYISPLCLWCSQVVVPLSLSISTFEIINFYLWSCLNKDIFINEQALIARLFFYPRRCSQISDAFIMRLFTLALYLKRPSCEFILVYETRFLFCNWLRPNNVYIIFVDYWVVFCLGLFLLRTRTVTFRFNFKIFNHFITYRVLIIVVSWKLQRKFCK